ncbi:MAG: RNA polymerase sigma factor [Cryomorphaceae bacterium]|nr:sigma-70 family RNA polymerase sigma factor [Flavobacteriales bacterium]
MYKLRKKYKNLSDEELLKSFVENQTAVIEALFSRYAVLCFGLSLKILKDREKAKDAVSDLFLKLRSDLGKNEVRNFKSWFYIYTRNHCYSLLRVESRNRKHEARWEEQRDRTPYDGLDLEARISVLKSALDELNPDQKRCIEKFYFEKKSYNQISSILRIPVKKVKSHLQNGKRNLRVLMNGINRSNISHHDW